MQSKAIKRLKAQALQKAYNELTPEQRLAKLNKSGWNAKKERSRLDFWLKS